MIECDVLVLAATRRELEGVLTKQQEPTLPAGRRVVGVCIGVGKVESALAAMQAIHAYTPSLVVLIGYAGAIDESLHIGDGITASRVLQYDLDLRAFGLGRGQTFDGDANRVGPAMELFPVQIDGFREVVLGTADRFLLRSYREQNPYLVQELGLGASDMEGYGVARACNLCAVPCTILRVVSDDARGHRPKDFKRFSREADATLKRGLTQLLEAPREKSPTSL